MVVMTRDQQVSNRVVTLDEAVSADELASIRNYINRNFAGWTLEDVRRELAARLDHASATYDAILRKLTLLYSKGLLDLDNAPEVHMEGASNLVGRGSASDQGKDARAVPRAGGKEADSGTARPVPGTTRRANSACTWGWARFIPPCGSFR